MHITYRSMQNHMEPDAFANLWTFADSSVSLNPHSMLTFKLLHLDTDIIAAHLPLLRFDTACSSNRAPVCVIHLLLRVPGSPVVHASEVTS